MIKKILSIIAFVVCAWACSGYEMWQGWIAASVVAIWILLLGEDINSDVE